MPRLLTVALLCAALLTASCIDESDSAVFGGAEAFGIRGRQPGQYSKPRAVAISLTGEIIVIDRTGRIQVLDNNGEFIRQWWLQEYASGTPTGISIDPLNNTIWVADTHYNRVLNYDLEGNLLLSFGEEGVGPGQFRFITDICPDPDGENLWITDFGTRNRVIQFTRDGKFVKEWGPVPYENNHDLERPMSVVLSPDGQHLLVVDTGNGRINIYDRDGNTVGHISQLGNEPGSLRYPQDIALAPDNTLYVIEYGNCRVSRFSLDGEFLGYWGEAGRGNGQLFTPWGIAAGPNGELIMADTMNDRLQLLRNPERYFLKQ